MKLNPYLLFDGKCEEAFNSYQKILGGEIVAMIPHEGTPVEESVPPEWRKKIIHARLVSNGMVLMGSDAPPDRFEPMKGFSVTLNIGSQPRQSACSMRWLTREPSALLLLRRSGPRSSACSSTSSARRG
jgi:uncharacterized glyoxalase superfamily protein PhnB